MTKRISFACSNRSEYGLIRPILREIAKSPNIPLEIQVILYSTAAKDCLPDVLNDFKNTRIVISSLVDSIPNEKEDIPSHYSRLTAFFMLNRYLIGDFLFVAGDRYEIFAIVTSAFYLKIPIAHAFGGDVSCGGHFDDNVRHAISHLSSIHFPVNPVARQNLINMMQNETRIFMCGSPVVDDIYDLDSKRRYDYGVVISFNPMTTDHSGQTKEIVEWTLISIEKIQEKFRLNCLATMPNHEPGSGEIMDVYNKYAEHKWISIKTSLGTPDYLYAIRDSMLVLGNSSSQLLEAPILGKRSLVLGRRQQGRYTPNSAEVLLSPKSFNEIYNKIRNMLQTPEPNPIEDYGRPGVSKRIAELLLICAKMPTEILVNKEIRLVDFDGESKCL